MKNIEVSDEMYEFLMNMSKEINTQNNRATASPFFYQIMDKEQVAVPEGCGIEAWHYDGSMIETDEEIIDAIYEHHEAKSKKEIEAMKDYEKESELEDIGYQKVYYDYKERLQNAFLTEKACEQHINGNKHHYHNGVSYVSYASRNPELETLLQFISELTKKI